MRSAFQRIIAKTFLYELEGEKKKCQELTKHMEELTKERLRDKKDIEEAKIEVIELRKERKRQQKENHEIRKQLIEIRKELRFLVGNYTCIDCRILNPLIFPM